jgi:putative transcriptional regulator
METSSSLAPGFLVAAPPLVDPNFAHSLVLLIAHGEDGALGLVINHGVEVGTVGDLLGQLQLGDPETHREAIHVGGPVHQEMGWIVYRPNSIEELDGESRLSDDVAVSPSREVLAAIARQAGPRRYEVYVGCAGWGPGQLEQEVRAGAWLPVTLDPAIVFDIPLEERWQAAFARAGVDPAGFLGHTRGQA